MTWGGIPPLSSAIIPNTLNFVGHIKLWSQVRYDYDTRLRGGCNEELTMLFFIYCHFVTRVSHDTRASSYRSRVVLVSTALGRRGESYVNILPWLGQHADHAELYSAEYATRCCCNHSLNNSSDSVNGDLLFLWG